MIASDTFMTFVDLNSRANPISEFSKIIRFNRNRLYGVVCMEYQHNEGKSNIITLILKSAASFNSAIVYYLDVANTEQLNQILQILEFNKIKLTNAIPDPPRLTKKSGIQSITLYKNEKHQFIERKIKELKKQIV